MWTDLTSGVPNFCESLVITVESNRKSPSRPSWLHLTASVRASCSPWQPRMDSLKNKCASSTRVFAQANMGQVRPGPAEAAARFIISNVSSLWAVIPAPTRGRVRSPARHLPRRLLGMWHSWGGSRGIQSELSPSNCRKRRARRGNYVLLWLFFCRRYCILYANLPPNSLQATFKPRNDQLFWDIYLFSLETDCLIFWETLGHIYKRKDTHVNPGRLISLLISLVIMSYVFCDELLVSQCFVLFFCLHSY